MQKFSLLFNKLSIYLILGLVVFVPLYPKFPLLNVSSTFVAIRAEDILIAWIVAIWFVGNLRRMKDFFSHALFQVILLFWFIGGLAVVSGIFITYTVDFQLGVLHWLRRIEYMSLFVVGATSVSNLAEIKLIIKTIFVVAGAIIIYGFGQIFLGFPVISTTNSEFSKGLILYLMNGARVNSTFAGHYDLAMYLTIILVMTGSFFFYSKSLPDRLKLITYGVLAAILLGFTAARLSFVATLFGLSATFWLLGKKIFLIGLVVGAVILIGAIPDLRHRLVATVTVNLLGGGGAKYDPPPGTVTIFTPVSAIPESSRAAILEQVQKDATDPAKRQKIISADTVPGEPINSTELGVYRSFGIRTNIEWPRAINSFGRNPILGTGYSSIALATDNDILRSLGETGLLGTLTLGLIFYTILKRMWNFLKTALGFEYYFILSMFCSVLAILITSLFIDALEASKIAEVFWLMLGLSWAVITGYRLRTPHS
ncbi:MAG: O-antigen ligase family protein [Candidatus Daviesbacteria bacterium]|nr:O-antigen ligase family protein [Candidatus Daviesbacteria bacterium]